MSKIRLQSQLTLFDVTNLVVGAIIGADIYVASTFGAQYLGPFSLLVWVIAGLMASDCIVFRTMRCPPSKGRRTVCIARA